MALDEERARFSYETVHLLRRPTAAFAQDGGPLFAPVNLRPAP
jgi:hypothetical protein